MIHGLRGGPNLSQDGHLLPCLFVLLPNKTQATYRRMWEQVQLLCPLAHPAEILMDFEKAAMTSFEHTWPTSMVKGCFFHLTQSLWRKVQAVGLQSQYSHDEEFANRIRQIAALAFAAPHEVSALFAQVAAQLPSPETDDLILYFERTYVGRMLPSGSYQQPLFSIQIWNYHFDVAYGLPRTTNAVEAWHRSFNATVGCHHPNIWKFISALKREQGLVEVKQAKYIAGDQPTKCRIVQDNDRVLRELIRRYLLNPRMEFLMGVAHRFSMATD